VKYARSYSTLDIRFRNINVSGSDEVLTAKAVPLNVMGALRGRRGITPTNFRPRL
jgi:hypothetical protein